MVTACVVLCTIWYHLYNLKNKKNIHGGLLILPATLLKLTFLHGCFSRFLNPTNGTKSRNASRISMQYYPSLSSLSILIFLWLYFIHQAIISFAVHYLTNVIFSVRTQFFSAYTLCVVFHQNYITYVKWP